MKKICIFYITRLSGHYKAARNICDTFHKEFPNTEIHFINLFQFLFPTTERIVDFLYMTVIKALPFIWHVLYDKKTVVKSLDPLNTVVKILALPKLDNLFRDEHPDVVITTQAFPCGLLSFYKKKRNLSFKLFACVTDYLPHGFWLEDNVDYFIVPSGEARDYFMHRGVPGEKILSFGIPIQEEFFENVSRSQICRELNLREDTKKVLVMGGGQGLGPLPRTIRYLDNTPGDFDIIIVCGRNRRLYSRLVHSRYRKNVVIFEYINFIHKLMSVSDIIITKPGGVTLTEALCKRLCIIVLKPLPGQEMNNTYFLKKHKIAEIAFTPRNAALKVEKFLQSERFLNKRRQIDGKFCPGHSSLNTARFIKEVLG